MVYRARIPGPPFHPLLFSCPSLGLAADMVRLTGVLSIIHFRLYIRRGWRQRCALPEKTIKRELYHWSVNLPPPYTNAHTYTQSCARAHRDGRYLIKVVCATKFGNFGDNLPGNSSRGEQGQRGGGAATFNCRRIKFSHPLSYARHRVVVPEVGPSPPPPPPA